MTERFSSIHWKLHISVPSGVTQLEGVDTGDFEANNAAAFLLSTESSKTIFIAVKDDDLPEADETFTFNLTLQVQIYIMCVYACGVSLYTGNDNNNDIKKVNKKSK